MKFDHLVITRFNVRVGGASPAGADWLRHRLTYFRDVCCPSVTSQTNQNFQWLVLFDSAREDWFEAEVQRLSRGGLFDPIWIKGRFNSRVVPRIVAERSSEEWLITSRLDNDDAIARDYVSAVQSNFQEQYFEFINFQSGLQLTDGGQLFRSFDPSNPFISLIEKRTNELPKSVYLSSHAEVERHGRMRQVKSHPMWLQMIHGRNLGNDLQGIRANPALLAEYFDINRAAMPASRRRLIAGRGKSAASLAWRVIQKPSHLVRLGRIVRNRITGSSQSRV